MKIRSIPQTTLRHVGTRAFAGSACAAVLLSGCAYLPAWVPVQTDAPPASVPAPAAVPAPAPGATAPGIPQGNTSGLAPSARAALAAYRARTAAAAGQPAPAPVAAAQTLPAPKGPMVSAAPAPAPLTSAPALLAPSPAGPGSVAGQARSFSTKVATYTAVGFDTLPGWSRDDFSASWPAFVSSCQVLARRSSEWQGTCQRAERVDARSDPAIRAFYEAEFSAYQIRDDERVASGVVTGYFEPEIKGSRRYGAPYIYPVYARPSDLLYLDARTVSGAQRGRTVAASVDGNTVSIQHGLSTGDLGRAGFYALDLSDVTLDTLDRKVRLRADGRKLVPYYTRQEIETLGVPNAKVLAFVQSVKALYEMQIQGSGRIRMADNDVIRVGYADQNGHPFQPTLAKSRSGRTGAVRTRGGAIELELDEGDDEVSDNDPTILRTRGFRLKVPATSGPVAVAGQRVVGRIAASGITDPSYVFFQESSSDAGGPVGAMGIPLSPGRSIAVDPRSTPLGYPVYVSTRTPDDSQPMQRLTIAQDTGGAIRGAVRADYFFGFGDQAASQARRMKEEGKLWVLLPRGLEVATASALSKVRTRGGPVGDDDLPQCLVPDGLSCVND